jgi:rod shape-determining protein MreC
MKKLRFAIIAVVLATIFHFVPIFNPAEAALVHGFLGVGYGLRSAAVFVGESVGRVVAAGAIEKENHDLKKQIIGLNEKLAFASGLVMENESLKGLLNFKKRSDLELVPCEVIGADPDATTRALIIDCGAENGLVRGEAVVVGDGTLVGKIERVTNGRSTVLLPIDPRSAVAVMTADHPETSGVAQGEKGLVISMTLIPQHAPIAEGDIVVTTGREPGVPRGLVLGKIESVNSVASDPFMSATIAPSLESIDLTKVAVIHQK